jgi:hypothetical protein
MQGLAADTSQLGVSGSGSLLAFNFCGFGEACQRRLAQLKPDPLGRRRDYVKRTWTIIGVGDVPASLSWYQSLFGQPEAPPAHTYFGQILDSDGTVLLCLHEWGDHEHPPLISPDRATPGNGLLLFFRVDDFDMALQGRALS